MTFFPHAYSRHLLSNPTLFFALSLSMMLHTASTSTTGKFVHVPASSLFVSTPPPSHFGNDPNEVAHAAWSEKNWLKSRFHFSFAEYYDPDRSSFGVLRVLNDDLVQPMRGFGFHPHRDMEIVTYVVDGELTHRDRMGKGREETLPAGSVQYMTAGSGVMHSEHNLCADRPLRFIQIWIKPNAYGLPPNYGSMRADPAAPRNTFRQLVAPVGSAPAVPVHINQDASMHVAHVDPGHAVSFEIVQGRQAYLLCVEGAVHVAGSPDTPPHTSLHTHDGASVVGPATLHLSTGDATAAHVLMLEMAEGP